MSAVRNRGYEAADAAGMVVLAMARQLLAGDRVGNVPEEAGQPPIVDDFRETARRLKIELDRIRASRVAINSRVVQGIRAVATPVFQETELVASDRAADEVAVEDVVRGWIRTTPPEQRNGLVAVIDELGVDVELFADDLQSDEGWSDPEGEPEPDGM